MVVAIYIQGDATDKQGGTDIQGGATDIQRRGARKTYKGGGGAIDIQGGTPHANKAGVPQQGAHSYKEGGGGWGTTRTRGGT